jgi:alkanesulfonate monooxygenase SsuD/methylene tetrahydromethanopterin reductase-like flavin-dependent oxidoreductase (luciferase family)
MAALEFGLNVSTSAAPGADPVAYAKRAEELGFDFVSSNDHPCGSAPTFETWTMLSWIAASTSRVRIATRVLGVPYRPPPMVAKMAETLDRLSGGRLILGLGGGASNAEFRAFGLGDPSNRDKTQGLEEAITIIRGLWSEPRFTFEGRIYHTDGAEIEPKPDHRIPIWLGTCAPRALPAATPPRSRASTTSTSASTSGPAPTRPSSPDRRTRWPKGSRASSGSASPPSTSCRAAPAPTSRPSAWPAR